MFSNCRQGWYSADLQGRAARQMDREFQRAVRPHTPVFYNNVFQSLPAFETKDEIAAEPTLGDVKSAIAALRHRKSPGEDGISGNVLKARLQTTPSKYKR